MFRLIAVLAIAWFCSQIPALYHLYVIKVDDDLRVAMQSGAPDWIIAALKQQRSDLIYADPVQYPVALLDAWETERALETVADGLVLQLPQDEVEWAYGGAGLVLGFLVTGILFAPFRVRAPIPAGQVRARVAAAASKAARAARQRPAKPQPAAEQASPWGRTPEKGGKQGEKGRIPASGGSLVQAAARLAREAARDAGKAARDQVRQQSLQGDGAQRAAAGPRSAQNAVETRFRRDEAIDFSRARPAGVINMSYARPPLIERRRVMRDTGPIERTTVLRD